MLMRFRFSVLLCLLLLGSLSCDSQPTTIMPPPEEIQPMPQNVVPMEMPEAPDIEATPNEPANRADVD